MDPITSLLLHQGPLPWCSANPHTLVRHEHGALASFIGVVRNEHHGKEVAGIDYQCHAPLAMQVLKDLSDTLRQTNGGDLGILIHHATGWCVPGDPAVIIHCASGHRAAAFAAGRQAIEALKQDLPIWKHEHYSDGTQAWLHGS